MVLQTEFAQIKGNDLYIDDVKAYTGITQGDMYHMDGTESSCIQAVRAMNAKVR